MVSTSLMVDTIPVPSRRNILCAVNCALTIIGYKRARELLYFGDQIDAQTALDIGMINRIVPLAELRTASLTYAKRLSQISPEALYATKRAVNRVADAAGFRTAPIVALRRPVGQPL